MNTDTDRLNTLEKMGNIAIWHGEWAECMGEKAGIPICTIYEVNPDGDAIGEEIAQAETLREAVDQWLAKN